MSRRSTPGALGSNPYVVGPPVYGKGPFFGREKALSSARGAASRGQLLLIDGAPRVGKSSFLLHIAAGAPASHIHCHLELTPGKDPWRSFPPLIAQALRVDGAEGWINGAGLSPEELGGEVAKAATPLLKKKRLILYLDIETGRDGLAAAAFVLAAVSQAPRVSAFIACQDAKALISQLPGLGEHKHITLGLLTPKAARSLIRSLTEGSLSFEEEAVLHLLDLSGRHPQILQALCHETFEYVRARPVDSVGMMEIVAAAKDLEKESGSLSWLFGDLERPLPLLLSAMAEAAPIDRSIFREELNSVLSSYDLDLEASDIADGLRRLEERGLVRRESKGRFAFNIELLRRWLIRHQPMADQPEARLDLEAAKAKAARHLEDGRNSLLLGRSEDAIDHLQLALKVQPSLGEARVELARAYVDQGDFQAGVGIFEKGPEPWSAGYREEVGQAYVQWALALEEAGEPADEAFDRARALVPEHSEVQRWSLKRDVEHTRAALNSARTWEALKAVKALGESGDRRALEAVQDDAMTHLEGAILAGAARKGRAVMDLVQLLQALYPEDSRPAVFLAEFIVGEGERVESKSPPAALSQYRRAEETLQGVREVPETLRVRLDAGQRRVAALFLQEQESSLEQLLADGQYDAAYQLAQELVEEHDSEAAKGILRRLSEREELEERYESILTLMARDGRGEARRLARELAQASPDFTGSDGRTAAQLLEDLRDEDTLGRHLRDPQPNWMPPTPAGRRGPALPLGPEDSGFDDEEDEDEGGDFGIDEGVRAPIHEEEEEGAFNSPLTWSIPAQALDEPSPPTPTPKAEPQAEGKSKGMWTKPHASRGGVAANRSPGQDIPVGAPAQGRSGGWLAFVLLFVVLILYVFYKEGRFGEEPEPAPMLSDPLYQVPGDDPKPAPKAVVEPTEDSKPEEGATKEVTTPKVVAPVKKEPAVQTPRPRFLPKRGETQKKGLPKEGESEAKVEAPIEEKSETTKATKAREEVAGIAKPVEVIVETLPKTLSEGEKKEAERHLLQAREFAQTGAYRSAVTSYEASLAIDGNQGSIYQDLGLIYYALKDLEESERAFRQSLKLTPNAIAQFDLGKVLRLQGKYIQAREAFEAALASDGLPPSMAKEAKEFLDSLPEAAAAVKAPTPEAPEPASSKPESGDSTIWGAGGAPVKLFDGEIKEE